MRLWILSDLHIELTRGWDLPAGADRPDFDVLVVAGDLIPRMERGVRWLRERVTDPRSGRELHPSFGYPPCGGRWCDVRVSLCRRIELALRDGETFEFVRTERKTGILSVDGTARPPGRPRRMSDFREIG